MAKKKVTEYLDRTVDKVPRTVRFPADIWEASAAIAEKNGISHNALIVAAVRKAVTEEAPRGRARKLA